MRGVDAMNCVRHDVGIATRVTLWSSVELDPMLLVLLRAELANGVESLHDVSFCKMTSADAAVSAGI